MHPSKRAVLLGLCLTQITSWGVLFYAFPVLQPRIAADTGWSATALTAAFSAALVISGLLGIPLGRVLDRRGPRLIMTAGAALAVPGLLAVAAAPSYWVFLLGWLLIGVAMSGTLYPPAFAALTRWYGARRIFALTMVTLAGGLASTVFAPVTEALATQLNWRETYVVLAVALGVVVVPVHAVVLSRPWPADIGQGPAGDVAGGAAEPAAELAAHPGARPSLSPRPPGYAAAIMRSRAYLLLVVGMALGAVAMYAGLINLVPMLVERGVSPMVAAWVLGLGGVGQVIGRFFYARLDRGTTVRQRSVVIYALLAITTAALAWNITAAVLLVAISMAAGVARGIVTLLQATAVTDRWGTREYGRLSGVLNGPLMLAVAVSPFLGAILADQLGSYEAMFGVLAGLAALGLIAIAASIPSHHRVGDMREK
ncbi:MFS transporter [Nesterenkonia sandarakina]|uniref:MFS transporter n=1 Tax=Nesterenkonia sandarakina TaxID=272918 RepID=A0A2T0YQY7_9MICC|nr:MFS transporter [Nesterenkonia sandarakina]PRZ17834.1 MFS transporter [Nesterenkonia sandarakina]